MNDNYSLSPLPYSDQYQCMRQKVKFTRHFGDRPVVVTYITKKKVCFEL